MEASPLNSLEAESDPRDSGDFSVQADPARDVRSAQQAMWVWIPGVILIGLVLRSAWVTDDAYITLRTVDNWVNGYGLRWNVAERVQAYTHPLWMFGLTLMYLVVQNDFLAAVLLGLVTTCASLFVLQRLARSPGHAFVAILLLASSRTYIDFATSGLENPLSHLLLACFVYAYLCRRDVLWVLAGLCALIALNRIDAMLLVLPALAHAAVVSWRTEGVRPTARALLIGFLPLFAWEAFSLFYYGTLVPNTAHAKLNTGISKFEMALQGVVYIRDSFAWDLPLLPIVGLGLALAFHERALRPALLAAGAMLYLLYVVRIGGDFMQGRFLDLPLFAAVCLIARAPLPLEQPAVVASLAAAVLLLFVHPNATEKWPVGSLHHDGVADEREYFRDSTTFMNWTRKLPVPRHGYVAEGYRFKSKGKTVEMFGCVGFVGFFSGPDVHIVDTYALADPLLARLPPRVDPFWRTGHYARIVPGGYVASLQSGKCKLEDRALCKYYEKLREVVSGELWSWHRLKTIIELNMGRYDHFIDYDRYRYPGRQEVAFDQLTEAVAEADPWNARGMRGFGDSGVLVRIPFVTHSSALELSLDGNDDYVVEWRRGAAVVGSILSPSLHLTGAHSRKLKVPATADKSGFDRVFIRPDNGDRAYSVGFFRLIL
jgi:arabinofuranosyltransferase